jgi:hypothetical protein
MLSPAATSVVSDRVRINDAAAVAADLIRVDFQGTSFNRAKDEHEERNSIVDAGFTMINQWLMAYRIMAGATIIKPAERMHCSWRLDYLDDDEGPLSLIEGLIRRAVGLAFSIPARATINAEAWGVLATIMPDYVPTRWDQLQVDATGLLPEIGPAILLAYTALEIRIASAADLLAEARGVDGDLWRWFTNKRPYLVQPETKEFAKDLFRMLAGRSLSDEEQLWRTFVRLRKARNSFAHEGIALDLETHTPLTVGQAGQLVVGARQILDWIDQLLPAAHRTKRATLPDVRIESLGDVMQV